MSTYREAGMLHVPEGFLTKDSFNNEDFNRFFDGSRTSNQNREQNRPEPVWSLDEPEQQNSQQQQRPAAWNDAPKQSLWSDAFEIGARPELRTRTAPREDVKISKAAMCHDWNVWSKVDTS